MALVGVLSTQLLHRQLVRAAPREGGRVELRTLVDRVPERVGPPRRRSDSAAGGTPSPLIVSSAEALAA